MTVRPPCPRPLADAAGAAFAGTVAGTRPERRGRRRSPAAGGRAGEDGARLIPGHRR